MIIIKTYIQLPNEWLSLRWICIPLLESCGIQRALAALAVEI